MVKDPPDLLLLFFFLMDHPIAASSASAKNAPDLISRAGDVYVITIAGIYIIIIIAIAQTMDYQVSPRSNIILIEERRIIGTVGNCLILDNHLRKAKKNI